MAVVEQDVWIPPGMCGMCGSSPVVRRMRGRGWEVLARWQSRSVSASSMSCAPRLGTEGGQGSGCRGVQGGGRGCSTYCKCAEGCGVTLRQAFELQAQKGSRASTHSPQLRYRLQLAKGTWATAV